MKETLLSSTNDKIARWNIFPSSQSTINHQPAQ